MNLSEKLESLTTSYATDEDRLQVNIHLTAELARLTGELAKRVEELEKNRPLTPDEQAQWESMDYGKRI